MLSLEALGVPESEDGLASDAAIASALRRAASFGAPVARQRLIGEVTTATAELVADGEGLRVRISDVLDRLLDHGDLLELRKSELGAGRHILLRPPAFVASGGICFPLGVRPDGAPILTDEEVNATLVHEGAIRAIRPYRERVRQILIDEGLQEVSIEQWIGAPPEIAADDLIRIYRTRLAESPDAGGIEGIEVLDPESDRSFYRGRFRRPASDEVGFFVARRPQQFGPSCWCFAEFERGQTRKVIDLPVMGGLAMPTDEAWRLQTAIDQAAGHPQFVHVSACADGEALLSFFGPLPSWARKRLDLHGTITNGVSGSLFAYRLSAAALAAESEFLSSRLWLQIKDVR